MKERLEKIVLHIAKFLMNLIYFFMKLIPTNNKKIVMLSRQEDTPSIDFLLLEKEILNRNDKLKVVMLCKKTPKEILKRVGYCFYLMKCMYHLATARICIINGYVIPVSVLKHKKKLVIVQIWHAMGAIKKFGLQITDKKEGTRSKIAEIMNMHKNYTSVICTSEATKKFYIEAFNVEPEKVLVLGMPRIDYVLGKNGDITKKSKEMYKEYPKLKDKINVLYVPTFRKNKKIDVTKLINVFNDEKYNLIIRLHPLDNTKVDEKWLVNNKYTTLEILKISDYVITDYSAIAFEAALLRKKLFFYLYDEEKYEENRGLNINLKKELPFAVENDIEKIYDKIHKNEYDEKKLEKFSKKYVETDDTNNTKRIIDYLFGYMN